MKTKEADLITVLKRIPKESGICPFTVVPSYFYHLTKTRHAIVSDEAGTTRDRQ